MNQLVIDLPPEVTAEEARLLLAIRLFEIRRLSMGQAARLAGFSRSTFIELLGKRGVPVFDYAAEDLKKELEP